MSLVNVYSASAGAGKTFTLTAECLLLLIKNPDDYKNILAVTFTNKASEEMKDRLVKELYLLKSGENSNYLEFLLQNLQDYNINESTIRKQSGGALSNILHDYSRFLYLTIDSFFQKILRSFMREINLNANYDLDLNSDDIIAEIVDKLIDDTSFDNELLTWVTDTTKAKMADSGRWDFRKELKDLFKELFKEKFEQIKDKYNALGLDRAKIKELINEVNQKLEIHKAFRKNINSEVLGYLNRNNITEQDIYYSGIGIISKIKNLKTNFEEPGVRFNDVITSIDKLLKNEFIKSNPSRANTIYNDLRPFFNDYISYYNNNIEEINSLNLIKEQAYNLGLIVDGRQRMTEYLEENDKFFIGDTPLFLAKMTKNNPTPFIYEKVGVFLKHYLIDEFQDTSSKQWEAFLPLITDAMASEENFGMVVGDVKQSIFGWRNGDWRLLAKEIHDNISTKKHNLNENWRSGKIIVQFNNTVFSKWPEIIQDLINNEIGFKDSTITTNYSDVIQIPKKNHEGYVSLQFFPTKDKKVKWKQLAMETTAKEINSLIAQGHSAGDIAILVRTNDQASEITEYLLEYQNNELENQLQKYQVVSSESLKLASNPAVIIITGIMSYLAQPENIAALYAAVINYSLHITKNLGIFKNINLNTSEDDLLKLLPQALQEIIRKKDFGDLINLTEQIIETAELNKNNINIAFIDNFIQTLNEFMLNKGLGLYAFIEWWNKESEKIKLQISEGSNAVKILTIHQSKGLGFPIVFIPFCDLNNTSKSDNIIWCNINNNLQTNISYLPIKLKNELKNSWFKKEYFEEKINIHQENLNLLYVSFTRSKDALYIFLPDSEKDTQLANHLKTIVSTQQTNLKENCINLNSYFDAENLKLEIGKIPKPSIQEQNIKLEKISHHVNLQSKKAKLKGNFAKIQASGNIAKGTLYHNIFELIKHADDVAHAVRKIAHNYQLGETEIQELETEINSFINKDKIKPWFTNFDELHNENWIVSPGGDLHKPDRVMRFGDEFIVLDYKFGQELPRYKAQIKNYLELLKQMGHQNCTGYIWYVFENRLHKIQGDEVEEIEVR